MGMASQLCKWGVGISVRACVCVCVCLWGGGGKECGRCHPGSAALCGPYFSNAMPTHALAGVKAHRCAHSSGHVSPGAPFTCTQSMHK